MKKIYINGKFINRPIVGVNRYAWEILRELDKLIAPGEVEILIPRSYKLKKPFHNLKFRQLGFLKGILWEQLELFFFTFIKRASLVNFCNAAPIFNPGIVCIHDMQIRANPDFYTKKYVLWHTFMYFMLTMLAKKIVTVSHFSKMEIEKYYPKSRGKITIIHNAWQHMQRFQEDKKLFQKWPSLEKVSFYFALSSLSPNKNFKWILKFAQQNSNFEFAIAGGKISKIFKEEKFNVPSNVFFLGQVSDEEILTLLRHCKALIYPSFYEGFGIPPLEALSQNVPIVISDIPALREIFGDSATYINPHVIPEILPPENEQQRKGRIVVLNKYSWEKSAQKLLELLHEN